MGAAASRNTTIELSRARAIGGRSQAEPVRERVEADLRVLAKAPTWLDVFDVSSGRQTASPGRCWALMVALLEEERQ
jgi:hypothetical protein